MDKKQSILDKMATTICWDEKYLKKYSIAGEKTFVTNISRNKLWKH